MTRIYLWLATLAISLFINQHHRAPADDVSTYTPFSTPNFQPQPSPVIYHKQSGMTKKPLLRIMPPRKEKAPICHMSIPMPMDEPCESQVMVTSISPISINIPIEVENNSQSQIVNPIVQNLREQKLGKAVFGYAIPITGLLVPFSNNIESPLFPIIILALCQGLVSLWIGMLLRAIIPNKLASRLELFGAVCALFAFFAVIGSFLPPDLAWIVWVCFLVCLLPLPLSFFYVKREMTPTDG